MLRAKRGHDRGEHLAEHLPIVLVPAARNRAIMETTSRAYEVGGETC